MTKITLLPAALLVVALAACGNQPGERALSGAGIGAGTGAVGGALLGANPITGAVLGGAVGAGVGALTTKDQVNVGK